MSSKRKIKKKKKVKSGVTETKTTTRHKPVLSISPKASKISRKR